MREVPYALLLGVVLLVVATTAAVDVTTHQAAYEATPTDSEAVESTTLTDLPDECRPSARSLAAGEAVSMTEHRVAAGPGSFVVRRTAESGWMVGSAVCADRFQDVGPSEPLTVDGETYRLLGEYERTAAAKRPLFGAVQVGGLIAALTLVGLWMAGVGREK